MPDATYQTGVYRRQGASVLVIGTTGAVVLDEGGEFPRMLRTRLTVAQVNAGATLLAAVPAKKYRLMDAYAIAVGGAVTSVTTVDILGTSSGSRKLVAFGQAALTQSALVRAGSAGGVILADGASFTQLDVNTAVTVAKTGGAGATATHVDVLVQYILEE